LKQFNQTLPTTGPPEDQQLIVSHVTPFGTRMVRILLRWLLYGPAKLTCETGLGDHSSSKSDKSNPADQSDRAYVGLL
jgi:hypothetical protein